MNDAPVIPVFDSAVGANLPLTALRVRERLLEMSMSQQDLADAVGATQGAISQIVSGLSRRSRLLPDIARALCVNLDWLVGNTDEKIGMFDSEFQPISEDDLARIRAGTHWKKLEKPEQIAAHTAAARVPFTPFPSEATAADPNQVLIDHIDLRFGTGATFLDNPVETEQRTFPLAWLRMFTNAQPDMLVWAETVGDSMEPTIRSGEPILIDRSQTRIGMGDGIWCFAYGELGMIKRLRPLPDGNIEIHSDNPLVRTALATEDEIRIFGRVIAKVGRL